MKRKYSITLLMALLLGACSKEVTVTTPDFDVTTSAATYKANDVITFKLSGDPGLIYFYSGTTFNDYAFNTGRVTDVGPVQLSFSSTLAAGTQKNQLSVLLSTDFTGKYDIASVHAATWTDITSRFALATSTTSLASGKKDITDLITKGKPFYIAFKYITLPQTVNGTARQSVIQNYLLETTTAAYGVQTLATQTNSGFQLVSDGTHQVINGIIPSTVNSTVINLNGNTIAGFTDYATEDWAITQPAVADQFNFGPDKSVPVKGLGDIKVTTYKFSYPAAGNYQATFVAANTTKDDSKTVVKQINITVTP